MGKIATKYFKTHPWQIIEDHYDKMHNRVAEAVFSLGNEYMGVRGSIDEGVSAETLRGSYFNGIYEYGKLEEGGYCGIIKRIHYMVNSVDYFALDLFVDGVRFDQAVADISDYRRVLDMQTGVLSRTLTWNLAKNKQVAVTFTRFLDMQYPRRAYQRVELTSNFDAEVKIVFKSDFNVLHWGKPTSWRPLEEQTDPCAVVCKTATSDQYVCSMFHVVTSREVCVTDFTQDKLVQKTLSFCLKSGENFVADKLILNAITKVEKRVNVILAVTEIEFEELIAEGFDAARARNTAYWQDFWSRSDIKIEGDEENQQGIRFCIFQLQQTYHGADSRNNIGAKGLTGEAYSGQTFWDTETYCLPYYLFNNIQAAKDLLTYRYNTLKEAKERAKMLDCAGACYPVATLNGEESCNLWQHASLQFQPSTAVAYGIAHYVRLTDDFEFLADYGCEMLVEICRFLASRGQWNATGKYFGFYAVMGPDEFQMMVNHNTYTNYMAKKTFDYTLWALKNISADKREQLVKKLNVTQSELDYFKKCSDKMLILYDEKTKLFEQHMGYYDLPHIDIHSIPQNEFPLYSHWSYDRIYRNDMIKQPDVLMFMFLYSGDFTLEQKRANYEFYEPRCIHESSLSPSVHSILAAEIGKKEQALDFFAFASRLDLDDYNRNTAEGLHTTSIAAAWMNVVYGFGGVRSDGKLLIINPTIPPIWQRYQFKLNYKGCLIEVSVSQKETKLTVTGGNVRAVVCGKEMDLCENTVTTI